MSDIQQSNSNLPKVGILGGGQLAQMMSEAYMALGGQVAIYADSSDDPATHLAVDSMIGTRDDEAKLVTFFNGVDLVTLENEFFDAELLNRVAAQTNVDVLPDPKRYALIEDKLSENHFFKNLGIDVADFFVVNEIADLPDSAGYLKLAKGGYDGIGTQRVANKEEAITTFENFSKVGTVLFEEEIECEKELSLIVAAGKDAMVFYPLVETQQEQGTCRFVAYPAGVSSEIEAKAQEMVGKIMQELGTQGLFAFELFLSTDGRVLLNESAPRPHNSGHITMDSMDCSQFENHMRAVSGMQLVEPTPVLESAMMVNLLATKEGVFEPKDVTDYVQDEQVSINLYGKKMTRIKRKMGHINLWGENQWQRARAILEDIDI